MNIPRSFSVLPEEINLSKRAQRELHIYFMNIAKIHNFHESHKIRSSDEPFWRFHPGFVSALRIFAVYVRKFCS